MKTLVKTLVKTPVKTPVKTADQLLQLLHQQPHLPVSAAAALGKSTSAIERAARKLREQGVLRYQGPQKGGYWQVLAPVAAAR